jgi:hypothetical protein
MYSYEFQNNKKARMDVFRSIATVSNLQWQSWMKPQNASMFAAFLVGGGAGGGAGDASPGDGAGAESEGGGGGGGSGHTFFICPAIFIPDILYINVGVGGVGGNAGDGVAGMISLIALAPNSSATNLLTRSGNAVPGAGARTSLGFGGTGGAGGTVTADGNAPSCGVGMYQSIAGNAGTSGRADFGDVVGLSFPVTGVRVMGGGGGSTSDANQQNGGSINAISDSVISDFRPQQAGLGTEVSHGYTLSNFFYSYGGLGGGANGTLAAALGGQGGYGGFGAGGGGGGGSGVAGNGTLGGKGGDGIVIIWTW